MPRTSNKWQYVVSVRGGLITVNKLVSIVCVVLTVFLIALPTVQAGQFTAEPKAASELTAQVNAAVYDMLDFSDKQELEFATRGLIEAPEALEILDENGEVVWSVKAFDFVQGGAPATANPSLWRHTQLNAYAGLFKVSEGIYQVRGYDVANVTFVESDHGWIVFDPLTCVEGMQASKALVEKHLGERPVVAVLYSHPHIDHFGGVAGLIDREDVADASLPLEEQLASGKTVILAPEGFTAHAVSENMYVGPAMGRRAMYQYGTLIEKGEKSGLAVGVGLGQAVGTVSFIAPTYEISDHIWNVTIDGVEIVFQQTPGTEAPCEMNAYFPQLKALWMAENCTGTLHNLYTLRGAQVRDGNAWAKYILEAIALFGDEAQLVFQSHNWPHWGNEVIRTYMENTAAVYKTIHDQTLSYINHGYTSAEISNMLKLPEELEKVWYTRQYYGTVSHDAKAVYQKYMGWYDANPVNLNLLPPVDTARKLVEYLGDVDRVLELALADFEKGEYQWVAQITKELVYADPGNQRARLLCADALEQLGYQAESGAWRNAYMSAALELRQGNQSAVAKAISSAEAMRAELTAELLLDYLAILIDTPKAQYDDVSLNLNFTDTGERFFVKRKDGVLLYYPNMADARADASITCMRLQFVEALFSGNMKGIKVEGDPKAFARLMQYVNPGNNRFNLIEP